MRPDRRIRTTIVIAATAMLALMLAAGTASAQSTSPSAGDEVVLRIGVAADLGTDNVFAVSGGSDWSVATTEYDMLRKFAPEDLTAAPSLATGCEHSEDYMEWTCHLQEGLLWSDGEPLTSDDVAFTYRFVIDNKIPQYKSYFPGNPVFTTPDETTLVWTSEVPTFAPDMPPWVYIVPEHVWAPYDGRSLKEIRDVAQTPAVGSGPFILTEWTPGQDWTMTRNPNYWGPAPTIDRVVNRLYTNQEAMIQALKNDEVDVISGLQPSLLASVSGTSNITVQKVVSDWWLNLAFNFGGQNDTAEPLPALHDHTVREAIAMAVDKQAIADKVYQGAATTGDTIIRPASAYWHLDIPAEEEYPYDPTAAAQMLQDAGYVDGDGDGVREDPQTGEPLHLLMPASSDTTGAVEAGELIVGFLKQVGISVELKPATDTKMNDYWGSGEFDAYIWYWSGDPDPNYQLFVFTSEQCGAWEDGCWKNTEFDALYEQQRNEMDQAARQELVLAAQRVAYEDIPGLVLAYPNWLEAYRNDRFTGWTTSPGPNGYLLPTYNYDSLVTLKPVGETTSSSSTSLSGWVWVVAAAAVAGIVVVVVRRGRRAEADEA
jgi:peptide/nickel transport system substrate-binding protein